MNRLMRHAWRVCGIALLGLTALALLAGPARAEGMAKPVIQVKEALNINRVGDGDFTVDVKLPIKQYTTLKAKTPNTALLVRLLGLGGLSWFQIEKVHGDWHDDTSTVQVRWTTRGLARVGTDGFWQVPVENGFEMIASRDNFAVFSGAVPIKGGVGTDVVQIVLPEGSRDLKVLSSPSRFAFHMPKPKASTGSHPALDVQFDTRPEVMTCLAKLYSNPSFSNLWVARAVVQNSGDQVLRDFRIRFHLADYTTGWGPWQRSGYVVPGQTVVNAYFPVFELDKVARLNGTSPATLEMEYEYRQADGQTIRGSDARTMQLLGHNEVLYSNLPADQAVTWEDQFNLAPIVLAAFVAHQDPVIQEVAGMVSGQGNGVAAGLDDKEAVRFLHGLYDFMAYNRIAYQTPPLHGVDDQPCQHVKYGRDVLRNRAGTCIDLAIFYGSVCEAVGLQPVLFVVPGHCFPAVRLPVSGRLYPVEATAVGHRTFEQATEIAIKEVQQADKTGQCVVSNIIELQSQGVHGLELPRLPATALKDWGYQAMPPQKQEKPANQPAKQEKPSSAPRTDASKPSQDRSASQPRDNASAPEQRAPSVVGKWDFRGRIADNDYHFKVSFAKSGEFRSLVEMTDANGATTQGERSGTYQADSQKLTTTTTSGSRLVHYYALQNSSEGPVLQIYMDDLQRWIAFRQDR